MSMLPLGGNIFKGEQQDHYQRRSQPDEWNTEHHELSGAEYS